MGASQNKAVERESRADPAEIVVGLDPDPETDPNAVPAGEVEDREEDREEKRGFWRNVRRLIGKEITDNLGFTIPIKLFEPTTNLTRACELFEFTELLDQAAASPDPSLRASLVAAFFVSEFRGYIDRKKPLTSMLGETFEWTRPDGGARVVAEMTESHPPAFGIHAEGLSGWSVATAPAVKAKFHGNSLEMQITTKSYVRLAAVEGQRPAETYAYSPPRMLIQSLFFGKRMFLWEGPASLECLETGYRVALNFERKRYEVNGTVFDSRGAPCRSLHGFCDEAIQTWEQGPRSGAQDLWRCTPIDEERKRNPCNMTPFALALNDPGRAADAPPTDSRRRGDLAALLASDHRAAAAEKVRVEEKQRARRREAAGRGRRLAPRWFRAGEAGRGELPWVHAGAYWHRSRVLKPEEARAMEIF
eukprot:tig00020571_g11485.t1